MAHWSVGLEGGGLAQINGSARGASSPAAIVRGHGDKERGARWRCGCGTAGARTVRVEQQQQHHSTAARERELKPRQWRLGRLWSYGGGPARKRGGMGAGLTGESDEGARRARGGLVRGDRRRRRGGRGVEKTGTAPVGGSPAG